jgi:uncharacterized protein
MLPEKSWKPETVLMLGLAIVSCWLAGSLAVLGLGKSFAQLDASRRSFAAFLVGTGMFHGGTILWVHVFLRREGGRWREAFGLWNGSLKIVLRLGGLAALVCLPAAYLLGMLAQALLTRLGLDTGQQEMVRTILNRPPAGQLVVYGLGIALLAPVAEEIFFRGVLYPTLKRSGHPQLALWVTALLFAFLHNNCLAFLPMLGLALTLVWLYEKTGNLLTPILTHILFNVVNFVLLLAQPPWLHIRQ